MVPLGLSVAMGFHFIGQQGLSGRCPLAPRASLALVKEGGRSKIQGKHTPGFLLVLRDRQDPRSQCTITSRLQKPIHGLKRCECGKPGTKSRRFVISLAFNSAIIISSRAACSATLMSSKKALRDVVNRFYALRQFNPSGMAVQHRPGLSHSTNWA